jgi:hypothetical protein
MKNQQIVLAVCLAIAACSAEPDSKELTVRAATLAGGMEFRHLLSGSRFHLGGPERTNLSEGGYAKTIGPHGVFATDEINGATHGVPNGNSPAVFRGPLTTDADAHNAAALDYFVASGLPKAEAGTVQANAMMAGGQTATGIRVPDRLVGFNSVVERRLGGIRVAESYAWVRFNKDGEAAAEGVYWPAIPAETVSAAMELSDSITDTNARGAFLGRIAAGHPDVSASGDGEIVIHHSDSTFHGAFEALASFDVLVRKAGEKPEIRHFDKLGNDVLLPHERGKQSAATLQRRPK